MNHIHNIEIKTKSINFQFEISKATLLRDNRIAAYGFYNKCSSLLVIIDLEKSNSIILKQQKKSMQIYHLRQLNNGYLMSSSLLTLWDISNPNSECNYLLIDNKKVYVNHFIQLPNNDIVLLKPESFSQKIITVISGEAPYVVKYSITCNYSILCTAKLKYIKNKNYILVSCYKNEANSTDLIIIDMTLKQIVSMIGLGSNNYLPESYITEVSGDKVIVFTEPFYSVLNLSTFTIEEKIYYCDSNINEYPLRCFPFYIKEQSHEIRVTIDDNSIIESVAQNKSNNIIFVTFKKDQYFSYEVFYYDEKQIIVNCNHTLSIIQLI